MVLYIDIVHGYIGNGGGLIGFEKKQFRELYYLNRVLILNTFWNAGQ